MKFNSRFPYIGNFRFTVRQHIAPPPTPVLWNCCLTPRPKLEEFKNISKIERSLRYPPLTGQFGSGILDLKLLAPLAGGLNGHTHVFTVEAQSDFEHVKRGQMMVAKVYDPVFMDDEGGILDSFHLADEHYTHEVRAYEELSEFQGGLIPKFYGSFSLDIPVTDEQTRAVRLILLEHIEGSSMEELGVQSFSQKERQRMMKAVVDFESWVYERNILLRTESPENVIVTDPSFSPNRPFVFVDFIGALFGRMKDDEKAKLRPDKYFGQYVTPIWRWNEDTKTPFDDWIDWKWQQWLESEYAHTMPSTTQKTS